MRTKKKVSLLLHLHYLEIQQRSVMQYLDSEVDGNGLLNLVQSKIQYHRLSC